MTGPQPRFCVNAYCVCCLTLTLTPNLTPNLTLTLTLTLT